MEGVASETGSPRGQWLPWLVLALALSAALRLWTVLTTVPHIYNDSHQYLSLAHMIGQRNLSADLGQRTPLYPALLVVLRYNVDVTRIVQMVLGLAITAAIFFILWTLTHRCSVAFLGAILYGLSLAQVLLESAILTETLTTFLLVMLGASLTWLWADRERYVALKVVATGICAGLVPLARPVYVYVPLFALAAVLLWVPHAPRRVALMAAMLAVAFVPVLAWSAYNYTRFDTFNLTTMTGFNLTDKTSNYVQDAPNKFAPIRDIYVAFRDAHRGQELFLIGHVTTAMMAATHESYEQLSKTVLQMDLGLIRTHPKQYLGNVALVFAQFWKGTEYDKSLPALSGLTRVAWFFEKWLFRLLNLVFLVLVAGWIVKVLTRRAKPAVTPLVWMSATTVVAGVLCALLEDGSNARFGMPTQPYVFCVVVAVLTAAIVRTRVARPQGEPVD